VMFRNATLRTVNDIRRIMMSQVKTLAIDIIRIQENKTSIQDEIIAHRLGMVPICLSKDITPPHIQDCDCGDFCSRCSLEFSLTVNPVRTTHPQLICHTDLKLQSGKQCEYLTSLYPIPLFLLRGGETLTVEGAIH
jgi:DNA-directed RNA polymerase II subunit RPB3